MGLLHNTWNLKPIDSVSFLQQTSLHVPDNVLLASQIHLVEHKTAIRYLIALTSPNEGYWVCVESCRLLGQMCCFIPSHAPIAVPFTPAISFSSTSFILGRNILQGYRDYWNTHTQSHCLCTIGTSCSTFLISICGTLFPPPHFHASVFLPHI